MPEVTDKPGIPYGTRYKCPLPECPWFHDELHPVAAPMALAAVFDPGVMDAIAVSKYYQRVEEVLRDHLSSHKLEEWVTEISRLRGELGVFSSAIEAEIRAGERERIAREIAAQKTGCPEHPMPLPKPSCWACGRDGAFQRAALIAAGKFTPGEDERRGH